MTDTQQHPPCTECGTTDPSRFMRTGLPPGLCGTCHFWLEKVAMAEALGGVTPTGSFVARVDGRHYVLGTRGEEVARAQRGHGGERFVVEFTDGRRVETVDLWSQGDIPERYRDRLPDNARFVPADETGDQLADDRVFVGVAHPSGPGVVLVRQPGLPDRTLANTSDVSPDGFNWGYAGSGPAALAYSMLAEVLGERPVRSLVQSFKNDRIAGLEQGRGWTMTATDVFSFVGRWKLLHNRSATEEEVNQYATRAGL